MTEDKSKSPAEETLSDRIAKIEGLENELMRKVGVLFIMESALSNSDMFIIGALKRTIAQANGFRNLIAAKNFPCAAAILRMHLDTAMRVNALLLVDDPNALCEAVLGGKKFNTFKDSKGKTLNDAHLRKKLSDKHPWINEVYEQTSDFVHLSGRHFYTSIVSMDAATGTMLVFVGGTDPPRPDSEYFEILETFYDVFKLIAQTLLGYFAARAHIFENKP